MTLSERFWSKVDASGGANACWPWMGTPTTEGYGRLVLWNGRIRTQVKAHRLSLALNGVTVPDDLMVLHSCDNRLCVNPLHLRLGTNADNMRDMYARGRQGPQSTRWTNCKRGHSLDGPRGRRCLTCHREAERDRRRRRAA